MKKALWLLALMTLITGCADGNNNGEGEHFGPNPGGQATEEPADL